MSGAVFILCPHGVFEGVSCPKCLEHAEMICDLEARHGDTSFFGKCDHGVSTAPWMDCAECETREDDFDA